MPRKPRPTTRVSPLKGIPEWRYQAEVVARLHKLEAQGLPITAAGDMAAGRRSRFQQRIAKLTGLVKGETDLRVYIAPGRLLMIELKTPTGSVSKEQRERHTLLRKLGFEVLVLKAELPHQLADLVEAEVRARCPGGMLSPRTLLSLPPGDAA